MLAQHYEIRIKGTLTPALTEVFTPWRTATEHGGTVTVITAEITDQADLSGLLQTVDSLGLELLEVRPRPETSRSPG